MTPVSFRRFSFERTRPFAPANLFSGRFCGFGAFWIGVPGDSTVFLSDPLFFWVAHPFPVPPLRLHHAFDLGIFCCSSFERM